MFVLMRRWRARELNEMREAIFLLRDQLCEADPRMADLSAAMGCCGCGAWMCDVLTPASPPEYPIGEGYCWACVDKMKIIYYTVLAGRER